jgi:hypothetical protein
MEYPFAASRGVTLSLPGRASMTARFFLHCQVRPGFGTSAEAQQRLAKYGTPLVLAASRSG